MPTNEMVNNGAAALGGGALSGGAVYVWLKFFMRRMIGQYDRLHEKHEARFEKLVERLGDQLSAINARLAAFEVRAAEIALHREGVEKAQAKIIRLETVVQKIQADVNEAHKRIRASSGHP